MIIQISFPSLKKFAVLFLMLAIIIPASFMSLTQKTEAYVVPVIDNAGLANWVIQTAKQIAILAEAVETTIQSTITAVKTTALVYKEYVLDPLARLLGTEMTDLLVKQMFSFVAKGNVINYVPGATALGTETYVTNPQQYFGGVAEESAQVFLTDLQNNRPDRMQSINDAVQQRIINENYVDPKKMEQSTFPGGDAGYQAFLQDASQCATNNSWDCYFASLEPQNNPWDVYQFESAKLAAKKETDAKLAQDEILAGAGYHTLKDCVEQDINANCTQYLNKTPGDAIAGQVNDYLNDALKNLQNADEIDEVISSVMTLTQDWMNGKGLASLAI